MDLESNPENPDRSSVAAAVKTARENRDLSIRELAQRSGCSASSISQIERNLVEPRLGTLVALASAMRMTVAQLMSDQDIMGVPQRDTQRRWIERTGLHRETALTARPFASFEAFKIQIQPGGAHAESRITHGDSQEFLYVVSGQVTLELGKEVFLLGAGDSIEYQSSVPHRYLNKDDELVELIWVASPPNLDPATEVSG